MEVDWKAWEKELFVRAQMAGMSLSLEQARNLAAHARLVLTWNPVHNLTRVTDPKVMMGRHYLDCLALVKLIPKDTQTALDIGAGAGFPGLVVAVVRPDVAVTLLEASRKKTSFLHQAVAEMKLANATPLHGRAEDLAAKNPAFDLVACRAVADLANLWTLAEPLLKPGGILLAMKGEKAQMEITGLEKSGGPEVVVHPAASTGAVIEVKKGQNS